VSPSSRIFTIIILDRI